MRPRPSLVVAVASGLAGLVLGLLLGRPSTAQPPAPVAHPQPQVGRYQVSTSGPGGSAYVVVIDTATGKCWGGYPHLPKAPWQEIVPPPASGR